MAQIVDSPSPEIRENSLTGAEMILAGTSIAILYKSDGDAYRSTNEARNVGKLKNFVRIFPRSLGQTF